MPRSQSLTPLARNLRRALTLKGMTQADVIRAFPEVSPATGALEADPDDYAQTNEERLALRMLRGATPELRQAILALLQAKSTK